MRKERPPASVTRTMRIFSLLLALGALALAGCGSDNNSTSSSDSAASTPAATTPVQAGGTVEIHMKDIQFDPTSVTAKVGQTVKWTNDDTAEHNVVATKGANFKSKIFGKGGTFEQKLDKPGTIDYVCTLHSNMKATITVEQ
jgi:plastocyanin